MTGVLDRVVAKRESGTVVTVHSTKRRVTQARAALQREVALVKDLSFLKAHARLTPKQLVLVDEAISKAADVVALYSDQYVRAATELIAANTK